MRGTVLGNTASGTKLPHIFCAGIGPLQLGVVLVLSTELFSGILKFVYLQFATSEVLLCVFCPHRYKLQNVKVACLVSQVDLIK